MIFPPSRYRWVEIAPLAGSDGTKSGDWLVALAGAPPAPALSDAPPALCRVLADVEPTRAGILRFADAYGALGAGTSWVPASGKWRDKRVITGEPLAAWREAIAAVRHALLVVDQAAGETRAGVTVRWSRDGSAVVRVREDRERPRLWTVFAAPDGAGDDRRAFLEIARHLIDDGLAQHVAPPSVRIDPESRSLRLDHEPRSLLGVIWLQVAALAEGSRVHRRCAACGRWFATAPDLAGSGVGARADARYCPGSDACRARAYRARKKRGQAAPTRRAASSRQKPTK